MKATKANGAKKTTTAPRTEERPHITGMTVAQSKWIYDQEDASKAASLEIARAVAVYNANKGAASSLRDLPGDFADVDAKLVRAIGLLSAILHDDEPQNPDEANATTEVIATLTEHRVWLKYSVRAELEQAGVIAPVTS